MQAVQRRVARAEADYARFRAAYLEIAQHQPDHEVALAMIGADMNRAHAYLQALIGLPPTPVREAAQRGRDARGAPARRGKGQALIAAAVRRHK